MLCIKFVTKLQMDVKAKNQPETQLSIAGYTGKRDTFCLTDSNPNVIRKMRIFIYK